MSPTNTETQQGEVHSLDERRARRALFCLERQLADHHGLPDHHDGRVVVGSGILGAEICYHDGECITDVAMLKLRLLPSNGWQDSWLGTLVIASNGEVSYPAVVQLSGPYTGCAVWMGDEAVALMQHRNSIRFHAPALSRQ